MDSIAEFVKANLIKELTVEFKQLFSTRQDSNQRFNDLDKRVMGFNS